MTTTAYYANQAANNLTLQNAIAGCMTRVSPNQITNIAVTPTITTTTSRRLLGGDNTCVVHYKVEVHDPSLTYASLTAELKESTKSGNFDHLLHQFALDFNATALRNCTVDALVTENNNILKKEPAKLTDTGIAGLAVGIVLAILLMLVIVLFTLNMSQKRKIDVVIVINVEFGAVSAV